MSFKENLSSSPPNPSTDEGTTHFASLLREIGNIPRRENSPLQNALDRQLKNHLVECFNDLQAISHQFTGDDKIFNELSSSKVTFEELGDTGTEAGLISSYLTHFITLASKNPQQMADAIDHFSTILEDIDSAYEAWRASEIVPTNNPELESAIGLQPMKLANGKVVFSAVDDDISDFEVGNGIFYDPKEDTVIDFRRLGVDAVITLSHAPNGKTWIFGVNTESDEHIACDFEDPSNAFVLPEPSPDFHYTCSSKNYPPEFEFGLNGDPFISVSDVETGSVGLWDIKHERILALSSEDSEKFQPDHFENIFVNESGDMFCFGYANNGDPELDDQKSGNLFFIKTGAEGKSFITPYKKESYYTVENIDGGIDYPIAHVRRGQHPNAYPLSYNGDKFSLFDAEENAFLTENNIFNGVSSIARKKNEQIISVVEDFYGDTRIFDSALTKENLSNPTPYILDEPGYEIQHRIDYFSSPDGALHGVVSYARKNNAAAVESDSALPFMKTRIYNFDNSEEIVGFDAGLEYCEGISVDSEKGVITIHESEALFEDKISKRAERIFQLTLSDGQLREVTFPDLHTDFELFSGANGAAFVLGANESSMMPNEATLYRLDDRKVKTIRTSLETQAGISLVELHESSDDMIYLTGIETSTQKEQLGGVHAFEI